MTRSKNKRWTLSLCALVMALGIQSLIASDDTSSKQQAHKRAKIEKTHYTIEEEHFTPPSADDLFDSPFFETSEETTELFSELPTDLNPFLTGDFSIPPQTHFFSEAPLGILGLILFQDTLNLRDIVHFLSTFRALHHRTPAVHLVRMKPVSSTELLTFQNLDVILQKFPFQRITVIDQHIPRLFPLLCKYTCNTTQSLNLEGYFSFFDDDQDDTGILPVLAASLPKMHCLAHLSIGDRSDHIGSIIGIDTSKALMPAFKQMPNLISLELWGCYDRIPIITLRTLMSLSNLEDLTLGINNDLERLQDFASHISNHKRLRKVTLSSDSISTEVILPPRVAPMEESRAPGVDSSHSKKPIPEEVRAQQILTSLSAFFANFTTDSDEPEIP